MATCIPSKRAPVRLTAEEVHSLSLQSASRVADSFSKVNANDLARVGTAMAHHESTFNAAAINPQKGSSAAGLTQIVCKTQWGIEDRMGTPRDTNRERIFDPAYALCLSMWYLCEHFRRYGTWAKALSAYNQGHPNAAGDRYARTVLAGITKLNLAAIESGLRDVAEADPSAASSMDPALFTPGTMG
ncbi:MAG: lytic transglycosylase domain-containing protein [Candidatus Kapaibacterium sp.]